MGAKTWCTMNRGLVTTLTVHAPDVAAKDEIFNQFVVNTDYATVTSLTINNHKMVFSEVVANDKELIFKGLSSNNLIELISYLRANNFEIVRYDFVE
jgi:hypothetical protein